MRAFCAVVVLMLSLLACASKSTADNCRDLQKQCLSTGKSLESHNAGSTGGQGSYNGGASAEVSDDASCDFSCVSCDAVTSGPGAGGGGADAGSGSTTPDGGSSTPDGSTGAVPSKVAQCAADGTARGPCIACVAAIVVGGSGGTGLNEARACICDANVCKTACGDSFCSSLSPGAGCDECMTRALANGGGCAATWQSICPRYAGQASDDRTYCSWPSSGLPACGY